MNTTEHILTCLLEEASEIVKDCSKSLRFGLDDKFTTNPFGPMGTEGPTNKERLIDELNDLLGVCMLLEEKEILPPFWQDRVKQSCKAQKVLNFMEYAITKGTLKP